MHYSAHRGVNHSDTQSLYLLCTASSVSRACLALRSNRAFTAKGIVT